MLAALSLGVAFFTEEARAGYYIFPESGVMRACADGRTTAAAVFPGKGYFLLDWNGRMTNAYPTDVTQGGWSPVLGGGSMCWERNISYGSAQGLINSWNRYCIARRSNYCGYD